MNADAARAQRSRALVHLTTLDHFLQVVCSDTAPRDAFRFFAEMLRRCEDET